MRGAASRCLESELRWQCLFRCRKTPTDVRPAQSTRHRRHYFLVGVVVVQVMNCELCCHVPAEEEEKRGHANPMVTVQDCPLWSARLQATHLAEDAPQRWHL